MGPRRINGFVLHFLQWERGFDLNEVGEYLSHYSAFPSCFRLYRKNGNTINATHGLFDCSIDG